MTITFRAAYFVAADGQSDVLLACDEQGTRSEADLTAEAVAVAYDTGLIGDVTGLSEEDVRAGLRIGDYTSQQEA